MSNKIINEEYFNQLCDSLEKNTKITEINFSNSKLPNGSSYKLLCLLNSNKTIKEINLDNITNISDFQKKSIKIKLDQNVSNKILIIYIILIYNNYILYYFSIFMKIYYLV